jgi:hypothetical protein
MLDFLEYKRPKSVRNSATANLYPNIQKWRGKRKKGKFGPCGHALLAQSRGCALRDSGDATCAITLFDRSCTGADLLL